MFRRRGDERADWQAFDAELSARVLEFVLELLAKPSFRAGQEWRWGRKESLSVVIGGADAGIWFDHVACDGGRLVDLVGRDLGLSRGDALAWTADRIGMGHAIGRSGRARRQRSCRQTHRFHRRLNPMRTLRPGRAVATHLQDTAYRSLSDGQKKGADDGPVPRLPLSPDRRRGNPSFPIDQGGQAASHRSTFAAAGRRQTSRRGHRDGTSETRSFDVDAGLVRSGGARECRGP